MREPRIALVGCLKEAWAPPLQLAYIASYLREYGGFEQILVTDMNSGGVLRQLRDFEPDVVGLSILTPLYSDGVSLGREIRREFPGGVLVAGGHHVTGWPGSLDRVFDVGVLGEGEETMRELMEAWREKGELPAEVLSEIAGLAFWDGQTLRQTAAREFIEPLDRVVIPDRKYLPSMYTRKRHRLYCMDWKPVKMGNLFTGRGCPYRCAFCSSATFWGKVRLHSVERVVEEIEYLYREYGVGFVHIEDDLFAINKARVREVAEGLRAAGLLGKVKFGCQPRMNVIDDEMGELLVSMGIVMVGFGFESGNEEMLKFLKGCEVSPAMAEAAVRTCKRFGLTVQGSVILGSPGETWEQMQDTRRFLDRLHAAGVDDVWPFIGTPLPGTKFWEYAEERGLVGADKNWDAWQFTRPNEERPALYDPSVSAEQFKDFYFTIQAVLEKRRPRPPLSYRLKRLPQMAGRVCRRPSVAWEVFKHRHLRCNNESIPNTK
ncbi:MAG: B12-binding domain-containing radical SAM protein [Planctomycetes bacterium]|nr:B12-binding domain-containing radical SAM protein [Planctomycetota bacterium]